ncbi:MAG: glycerate kinase type-2 family protein [Thermoplasmata archaeon]
MTLASDALAIARAGIAAVDPDRAVHRAIRSEGGRLRLGGRARPDAAPGRVHVMALGKASASMYDAAQDALGRFFAPGVAVVHAGYAPPSAPATVVFGDHPVPGEGSFAAGATLLERVRGIPHDDLVLFLISGGGSSLAEAPVDGVPPADLAHTTSLLLASGAPIQSMNAIRRHLSATKGGRLAAATGARAFVTLAISDVVGDRPCEIASGPTVADPTTYGDAMAAVHRYQLAATLPASVLHHLEEGTAGRATETPKPGDPRLASGEVHLIATNRVALRAAEREARRRRYATTLLSSEIVGETRDVAGVHGALLAEVARRGGRGRRCLLSGGETTVTLGTSTGRGGRNQEFALSIAPILNGLTRVQALSVGTDGIDGPTDAAGGSVDGTTMERARSAHVDVDGALDGHAAYDALARLGALLTTGPTGTNVMDVHVLLWGGSTSSRAGSSRRGAVRASRRRSS